MIKILMSFIITLTFSNTSHAALKSLSKHVEAAMKTDGIDMSEALNQIQVKFVTDKKTKKSYYKVVKVAKGSFYQRKGIKPGMLLGQ